MTSKELCEWFSLGQSTISGKSKLIRDLFGMGYFDSKWCLPSKMLTNPMIWMVSVDGLIVDIRRTTFEVQKAAFEAGAIPFIPSCVA
jgi:hypothetical protein